MAPVSVYPRLARSCRVLVTRFQYRASITLGRSSNEETGRTLMLRIDIQRDSRSATLHCHGRIVFGMEIETLRSVTMSRTERALEIDLAGIETVDASGLGLL